MRRSMPFACFIVFVLWMCGIDAVSQVKPSYQLFTKEGKVASYDKMIKELAKADVILFGELHNNALNHWLELQVAKDVAAIQPQLTLGFEMFESDNQLVLEEYLSGVIEERHFLSEAKVWDNYKQDYKPLLDFAKAKKLPVVATNIPRRYANLVYRNGIEALEKLPSEAKQYIAPLPIRVDLTLPGYNNMLSMGGHQGGVNENMPKSQAVKDATMAYFILKNKSGLFLHFHGAYHAQNFEGIYHYLKQAQPNLNVVIIHSVEQENLEKLEEANKNSGDYIICLPVDMAKSY
jgi:uncharacterized iron-regulated protein